MPNPLDPLDLFSNSQLTALLIDFWLLWFVWWLYRSTLNGPFIYDDMQILSSGSMTGYLDPAGTPDHPLLILGKHFYYHVVNAAVVLVMGRGYKNRQYAPSGEYLTALWHIRPITWLTYHLDALYGGLSPKRWHRSNIWIHALSVVTAYHVGLHLLHPIGALIAALVFAVHPLSTMAVSYIAGRSSALCSLFMLLSVLSALSHQWLMLGLSAFLAFFSKEEAMILPVLLGGLWWLKLL